MTRRYDMTLRNMKRLHKSLKQTLADIQREVEHRGRSRKERRTAARLDKLPLDRRCPGCGDVKLRSRQWVIVNDLPLCKSCFMKR